METVFITGVGSGIGQMLAETYRAQGATVYAVGQHEDKHLISDPEFHFFPLDFRDPELIRNIIRPFVEHRSFTRVILNSGTSHTLRDMRDISLNVMRETMNVNLWAHKQVLDALLQHANIEQVIALSASPGIFEHRGWGACALSKAALNTLIRLYAEEVPKIHFSAIAPYLTHTPMIKNVLKGTAPGRYPSLQRIKEGRVLTPEQSVSRLIQAFDKVRQYNSGLFFEMHKLEH